MMTLLSCNRKTNEANQQSGPDRLEVLFLGDDRGHHPHKRLRDVARPMLDRGIKLFYSSDIDELELQNLKKYDAVLLYANYHEPHYPKLPKDKEQALIDYVEQGGGFVPIHSASGNFRNSEAFINLLGGAFKSHGTDSMETRIAEPDHEIMKGFKGFESWDETYVHKKHNTENRTVLSYRGDEPWTWIRTQGDGRVFYTAWGHDERTWRNEGFQDLLERGIRWAAGRDVQKELDSRKIENPFEYEVLDVPYPPPHEERVKYEEEVGPMDRESNYPKYYKKQKPLSPEKAIDRMILPPGFHIELFASEPDIVNPIDMNWDEQGRLWVIESIEYPYPKEFWPDGGGKDRIIILEDTNGDGKADKFTEFADSLNIPTSLTFANGGIIVQQAPQTLFLKDTNGDDKADVRKVLFEGWSQYDTHAGPSHLRYGLDNWIWGTVGYSGFEGTVGGKKHKFKMGGYRFKQDGSELEFIHRTNNNTWGLGFREGGDVFISTANGNPSTFVPFPQRTYNNISSIDDPLTDRLTESARVITLTNLFRQVDWVGAFTSASGHGVYTARKYPQKYWNKRAFVMDPTMQMVGEFILNKKKASYQAEYPRNLIASDDEWFSPIVAEVGPDGQIWMADWYNYIIQHNAESDRQEPTPGNAYANPLRDRQHGRIYRIVYKDTDASYGRLSLKDANNEQLIETLNHDNLFWRKHAQRLLVEQGDKDVAPDLIKLINNKEVDKTGLNVGAIHGLWTLHGLGLLDKKHDKALKSAIGALKHPSEAVRRNAVKVLPKNLSAIQAILDNNMLQDESSKVKLATLVALANMPESVEAGNNIFNMFQNTAVVNKDEWIASAGALAAAQHASGFLQAAMNAGIRGKSVEQGDKPSSLANLVQIVREENPDFAQGSAVSDNKVNDLPPNIDARLEVGVTPNVLEFSVEEISAKAGQTVQLVFKNTGNMEHNLLILKPGTLQEVGKLADQMISTGGRGKDYVPDTPAVIANTPIIQPGETITVTIKVPDKSGEYPYICTIPGHWRSMQGTLIIKP